MQRWTIELGLQARVEIRDLEAENGEQAREKAIQMVKAGVVEWDRADWDSTCWDQTPPKDQPGTITIAGHTITMEEYQDFLNWMETEKTIH